MPYYLYISQWDIYIYPRAGVGDCIYFQHHGRPLKNFIFIKINVVTTKTRYSPSLKTIRLEEGYTCVSVLGEGLSTRSSVRLKTRTRGVSRLLLPAVRHNTAAKHGRHQPDRYSVQERRFASGKYYYVYSIATSEIL